MPSQFSGHFHGSKLHSSGFEEMTSSIGLQERRNQRLGLHPYMLNKTAPRNTAIRYKMNFPVYSIEVSLFQSNVSLIKLAFSSRGIVLELFVVKSIPN